MEEKIIKLFTRSEKLKFNEIEKLLHTRSNKVAYHIKNLLKKGVLEKNQEFYQITETAEYLIPYLSEKKSPLVVVLIKIGDSKKAFLYPREKRPFKNKLSLPGGRLLVGETFQDACKRIMKEKHNLEVRLEKIQNVSLEFAKRNKKTLHSFILFLVTAKTKEKIELTDIEKSKSKIIKSDYELIKNKNPADLNIKTFNTKI
jgi:ADP-ribose pyrophosphatase YjhB (NUDIX family)